MNENKILLVQLFSNGDCLLATTVARQIKQDHPGCHLTWAIADFCRHILDGNPFVDEVRVVHEVKKNDVVAFRKFRKKLLCEKKDGIWKEVFITHNMDANQALYDGTIRGMILRAYPGKITVPVQPVLVLSEDEKQRVAAFAARHRLGEFRQVVLWEYAPQSGQSRIDLPMARRIAEKLTAIPGTAVILSSAKRFEGNETIIDGSVLTIRENAELTRYCSLLVGCSSGITWLSTSTAASPIPMIQLLDPGAYFFNPLSRDFRRHGISDEGLLELVRFDESLVGDCIGTALREGFAEARRRYNQEIPLRFNSTRKIVYNLLCYLQFGAIAKHYHIMTSLYGRHPEFLRQFLLGIITAPFRLVGNFFRKRVLRTSPGK